ncbi:acyl-CoA carboxylase subunit epsilon [Streptomyces actinocidus]
MHSAQGEPALLRIERGQVTEEELAALTVALTALLAAGRDPAGPREGPGAGRPPRRRRRPRGLRRRRAGVRLLARSRGQRCLPGAGQLALSAGRRGAMIGQLRPPPKETMHAVCYSAGDGPAGRARADTRQSRERGCHGDGD